MAHNNDRTMTAGVEQVSGITQGSGFDRPDSPFRIASSHSAPSTQLIDLAALLDVRLDLRRELQRDWTRCWVAHPLSSTNALAGPETSAPDPLGLLLVWCLADAWEIIQVGTGPAHRRQGVARNLMCHLLEEAHAATAPMLILEVRASNLPAVELYREFSFEPARVRRHYYSDGEDGLEMRRSLTQGASL